MDDSASEVITRWLNQPIRPAVVPAELQQLVEGVKAVDPSTLSRNDLVAHSVAVRQSAVLILIATEDPAHPDVLLQQRATTLRNHAGQIAFPGGARDQGDDGPVATALREAVEETAVDPATIDPLIVLPRLHIPPSGFDVTGVIAHWRTPTPVRAVDPNETARVMRVPLARLADPANRLVLVTPSGWRGPAFVIDGTVIWGFTGEILAAGLRLGGWEQPWDTRRRIEPKSLSEIVPPAA